MNDPKTFTKSNNVCGPGYIKMTNWIVDAWMSLSDDYLKESFKYCAITSCNINEYHSNLIKLLQGDVPPNATVDFRNEEDLHDDAFVYENESDNGLEDTEESADDDAESSYMVEFKEEDGEDDDAESIESIDINSMESAIRGSALDPSLNPNSKVKIILI